MDGKVEIIYEDDHVIVCRKPAGMATETARVGQKDMVSQLKNELAGKRRKAGQSIKGEPYLGVVHRLDQPVEGLLVFGKDKAAAAKLSAQLREITLNKHYRAVVCGQPSANEGELVDHLYKNKENRAVAVTEDVAAQTNAKRAVLQYQVLATRKVPGEFSGESISLLDIRIDTGRFHQIRAQMAHAGHPLLGDQKYGDERCQELSRQLGVQNVALCAYKIEFRHPATGKRLQFAIESDAKIFGSF
ncbi:MAG: RluA family pseudouridine synthase [Acetatifactor sp.]|nr:RluA family pseudouridine synthase [Acetatifactor sp.]